jgi:4-hydroxybenzoate polyprenyltransferase
MSSRYATAIVKSEPECIVVDLDGTLVFTNTFVAAILEVLRKHPFRILALIAALFRGRAECKRLAASLALLDVASLPYNQPLIEYLRQQKAAGRRILLATGADGSIARAVADHLDIFEEIIASENGRNVTGAEKVRAIRECIGEVPFTYAGNSRADLKVWYQARTAILIGAPRSCTRLLRQAGIAVQEEAGAPRLNWRALIRCLRWHQWSKNVLVFLPLIASHQVANLRLDGWATIGFLALSCTASALYIVNDLLDLQADRLHPNKRRRPLASGSVSIQTGIILAAVVASAACALGWLLPMQARLSLAGYALASLLYSLKLKQLLFVDVISLAVFYTFRVVYGGAVTGIRISVWTLAFSLFLFTSLATVKRLTELRKASANLTGMSRYRGYRDEDANHLSSLAAAAGYVAVLVLALYINSPDVQLLYRHPQGLWLLCPVLIYWISRFTLIANRGHLDEDPVASALKDVVTWVTGFAAAIIVLLST